MSNQNQPQPQCLYNNICPMCMCIPPGNNTSVTLLDANIIPKYTTKLPMTKPVQPHAKPNHYKIGLGKTEQQMLPLYNVDGTYTNFLRTPIFGYGVNNEYSYPFDTIEVNHNIPCTIEWVNELVDIDGNFIPHILPIDQTLHWANPVGGYALRDSDMNPDKNTYNGAIPIITHVHGLNSYEHSDGWTESWYLPKAKNIDSTYAKVGSKYEYFRRQYEKQFGNSFGWSDGSIQSFYENNDSDGTYWYHDHTLGLTRTNVYAGAAGFYILRNNPKDVILDSRTNLPAILPNNGLINNIYTDDKELQIVIADKSFNLDCSLFFPSSRSFFEGVTPDKWNFVTYPDWFDPNTGHIIDNSTMQTFKPNNMNMNTMNTGTMNMGTMNMGTMNMGTTQSNQTNPNPNPNPNPNQNIVNINGNQVDLNKYVQSDVHKIINPEFFGNTIVVNGVCWPFHNVNKQRYRLRLLNGSNSRTYIIYFGTVKYPFAIIGTDGNVLNNLIIVNELIMMPGERYDIIFDFAQVLEQELIIYNIGPDIPFNGTNDIPSDPNTTGQIMKFIIDSNIVVDNTTPLEFLILPQKDIVPDINTIIRDLCIVEYDSNNVSVLMDSNSNLYKDSNGVINQYFNKDSIPNGLMQMPYGPVIALVGVYDVINAKPIGLRWMQSMTEYPVINTTEIWRIYNTTGDAHPMHVHLVQFEIVGREPIDPNVPLIVGSVPQAWETSRKDVVISYPGEILIIKMIFNKSGLYVWHCHMIDHEDNEIMRPMYIKNHPDEIFDIATTNNLDVNMNCGCTCVNCTCGPNCMCGTDYKCGSTCNCGNNTYSNDTYTNNTYTNDTYTNNTYSDTSGLTNNCTCGSNCTCGPNCMCGTDYKCDSTCNCTNNTYSNNTSSSDNKYNSTCNCKK